MRRQGGDVQVVDGRMLRRQGRQLVEVCGKEAEAADFGGDVLTDRPGQPEAIVRRGSPSELIDDDEGLFRS